MLVRGKPLAEITDLDTLFWDFGEPDYTDMMRSASDGLSAFIKLKIIAAYLNEGWKRESPRTNEPSGWGFTIVWEGRNFMVCGADNWHYGLPYFRSKETAAKAIELMGEAELKQLFDID